MSELLPVLLNRRRLRAALNGIAPGQLSAAREVFEFVFSEMESEFAEQIRRETERKESLDKLVTMAAEAGISLDDLRGHLGIPVAVKPARVKRDPADRPEKPEPKGPKPPKRDPLPSGFVYRYERPDGEIGIWYGRGRLPYPIREAVIAGTKTYEDFIVAE